MEGTRGRSRTRSGRPATKYPRAMSISGGSRSRSRNRGVTTVLYMPAGDETKYFDTSFSQAASTAADWTGSEVPCTNYVQSDGTTVGAYTDSALIPSAIGAGFGQVVGSKYKLKKIRVRGSLQSSQAADQADVLTPTFCRIALVLDTRPNGAQAQGEDVFLDMGTSTQVTYAFQSMGAGQAGRFRILKDYIGHLDPVVAATDGANTSSNSRGAYDFSFTYKPRGPIEVLLKANSSTPTVASLSSCNIFLLVHSSASAGAVTINGCARAYYVG